MDGNIWQKFNLEIHLNKYWHVLIQDLLMHGLLEQNFKKSYFKKLWKIKKNWANVMILHYHKLQKMNINKLLLLLLEQNFMVILLEMILGLEHVLVKVKMDKY